MVKGLQHHLLMRGIFWMRRVQYSSPPSDDLYIWAKRDQLRDSGEFFSSLGTALAGGSHTHWDGSGP